MSSRRQFFRTALLAVSTACLQDSTGPEATELYLLRRIGTRPLPTYLHSSNPADLALADTLAVPLRSIRDGGTFVIRRVQVGQDPPQPVYRFERLHRADVAQGSLVIDTCPLYSFCIDLVYAPFTLTIVGDSLFEVPPAGSNWEPRVYGLVRRSGRVR